MPHTFLPYLSHPSPASHIPPPPDTSHLLPRTFLYQRRSFPLPHKLSPLPLTSLPYLTPPCPPHTFLPIPYSVQPSPPASRLRSPSSHPPLPFTPYLTPPFPLRVRAKGKPVPATHKSHIPSPNKWSLGRTRLVACAKDETSPPTSRTCPKADVATYHKRDAHARKQTRPHTAHAPQIPNVAIYMSLYDVVKNWLLERKGELRHEPPPPPKHTLSRASSSS